MIDGPQDLRVTAVTPTTMELSWLRPQAEVDRFVVSYVSAGNQRVRLNVAPEEDRTLLTGLMPGVEYVMTVTAERGRAVSYPASVRANTAPAHHNYQDTRPPAPPPRPPVQPQPQPGLRPDLGPRLPQPVEEEDPKPREVPLGLPPPRFLRNLTSKLGLSWGSVQDVERYLRASGYPLRGNQTYTSVARSIYAYLQRRAGGLSAPPSSLSYKPQSTANLDPDTRKPHSAKDIHGHNPEGVAQVEGRHIPLLPSLLPGPSPRHPKPEVLGSSADGALLVSLDGLRGQFEQVVLRWQPLSPMEGPSREIAVPGATRIARLPGLRPSTTYHVEVHGVQDGQASKSYAFITTTGPFEATDESLLLGLTPPPTTQGAQAPLLKHPVNKPGALSVPPRLGELQVLDVSSNSVNLHWTVPEGRFDSFLVQYKDKNGKPQRVPVEGLQHSVIISPLDPGHNYKFTLYGLEGRKRHGPLTTEAKTSSFPNSEILPRLGELRVTDPTSESLHLSWSVPEGQFDSFLVQYKDRDGQIQVVPVEGPERSITISSLDPSQRYKFILYGLTGKKRHGPLTAEGSTAPLDTESPKPRVGKLIVTDVTQNSLRLLWTILEGKFDSFVVQYKDKDGQPQVVPVEAGQNEVTISDLQPSRKYKMNLYGLLGKQRVGPISVIVTTDPFSVEPHLGEVTVTDVTPDSLRLSWTTKGEFDSFEIQYKDKNGQPKVVSTDGIQDEVTISSLEHSRKYKFLLFGIKDGKHHGPISVEAKTAREEKTPVLPSLVTDALQLPAKPHLGKLMVTNATSDSLQLLWTSPKGQFESFVIQYKNGDGQPKVVHVKGDKNTIIISGLEPDHKYKMNLYGFHDGQRMGPISITGITALHEEMKEIPLPTVSATEAPEPTEKPELGELTVTGATSDSLKLSWTISQGEFDSFIIQYKDRYERPQIVRVGGDQNEVTVSELEPDHRYKMNLYGFHDGQRVGPVSVTGVTAPQEEKTPAPTVPAAEAPVSTEKPELGDLTVIGATPDSLKLFWTISQGEFDSFTIQYKDRDGRPQIVRVEGDQNEVTVSELEPDHRYKMNLYGFHDGHRMGPVSVTGKTAPHEEETPAPTVPATEVPVSTEKPELGDLTVIGATPDSLKLFWTVSQGEFDSFTIQYKDRDGRPQIVRVEGDQNEVIVSELEPDHRYKMNLYGFHNGHRVGPVSVTGKTDQYKVVEQTPAPTVPATEAPVSTEKPELGDVTVVGATPDSLKLFWTVSQGEFDSFTVQYKDRDGRPQIVRVEGDQNEVTVSELEPDHRYKMNLYGFHDGHRVGPVSVTGKTDQYKVVEETPAPPTVPATEAPVSTEKPELGDMTVIGATPDSLKLFWTVSQGEFDSFTIQYKDRDGRPQIMRVEGDQNEVTVSELEPDHRYKMNLYGFHDGHRVGPVSVTGKTGKTSQSVKSTFPTCLLYVFLLPAPHEEETPAPTVPATEAPVSTEKPELGDVTVIGATPDSLKLFWTISQGEFDSFTIQYKDRDGRPQIVRVEGDQNEVTVSELEPDHRYKMNLYGFHDGHRVGPVSVTGKTDQYKVVEETPALPTVPATEAPVSTEKPELGDVTVIGATPDSLKLFWTVSQGEFDSFTIQYKDRDGRPQIMRVEGDQNEVTVSELEPDHRYKMNLYGFHDGHRVGPVSVTGKTAPHEEETPAPTVPATEAPVSTEKPELGDVTVIGATPDSLKLFWTISQGEFDSFTIQYKDRDGRPQIVRVEGDQNEVTVSELDPDHRYKMNLYGFHDGHRVGPISVTGKTDQYKVVEETSAPPVPATEAPVSTEKPELGDVTVIGATPDSLKLFWTVSQGEFDSFTIQYKDRDGRPQIVRVEGDQNEVTVSELEPDHRYKMNLYGFHDGHRIGPVSVTGKTGPHEEETPAPTVPATGASVSTEKPELGDLTVIGATPDSLKLFWTVSQGEFDSFTIQYKDRDGRPQIMRVEGDQNEVTVSELDPDHRYKMNLYGFHDGHRVGPVSVTGKTAPHEEETPAPTVPATEAPVSTEKPELGDVTVIGATPDSLKLFWTISQGEFDSFTIQYKDRDGRPQIVHVEGDQNEVTVSELEPDHRYKMNLYGFHDGHRVGPVSVTGKTAPYEEETLAPTVPATEAPVSTEKPELGDLTVIGATPDSLKLFWTVSQGEFDSFTIQYKDRDGRPQIVRVEGDQNEVTVSDLEPDHRYKMNLYGFHDGHRVGPVSVTGKTDQYKVVEDTPAPTVPATEAPVSTEKPGLGEVTVIGATPDSLKLFWTVSQGEFDSFTIQYKDRDGRPQIVRVEGDQNEVTVSELEPDHRYKMNLYGFHDGHRVGPVSVTGKTAPHEEETPAPTVPATEAPVSTEKPELGDVTVIGATPGSLKLFWTISQGEFDYFTIQYKDRDGRPQIVRVEGDQNEVTVSELDPDHRYKMNLYGFHDGHRVGPVSVTGKTAPHEEETPAPTVPATEAPVSTEKPELGDVTVIGATPDSLKLFWTISQGEFDSFTIQYKDRDGRPQIMRVEGDQNEVTVSELEPDHRYKMNLYGFHDGHRVGPVSVTGKTAPRDIESPSKPYLGELTVTDVTQDSLHLTWNILQGSFDSFVIQYKNRDGQPQVVPVAGDQNEITISDLEPSQKYKFLLFGLHNGKRSVPISADAKTLPAVKPAPLLGEMTVTDPTSDSLHLSWTILQGHFDSFVVQYKDKSGQLQVVPVGKDQREITISSLEPNRKYKFLLYGLFGKKRLGPVSTEGTTAPKKEDTQLSPQLGEMKATDATPNSLRLSWTVSQGPFDSFLVQYKDKNGQPQVLPVVGNENEVIVFGLEPKRKYMFLLYGLYDGKRVGPISAQGVTEEETATSLAPATEIPELLMEPRLGILKVTDVAPNSLGLSWTVLQEPFNSFVIQYKDKDGKSQAMLVRGDQKKITISNLEANRKYTFLLYGLYDGKRLGPISTEATTGLAPAGQSPGGRLSQMSVSDVTTSSFRLNWEAPPGAFDSFLLRYGIPEIKPSEPLYPPLLQRELSVPGIQRSAVIRDLRPGTLYAVTLYGLRGPHKADSLQGTARTLSPVLESPRNLKFSEIQENSARVSWTPPPSQVDGFKISYQLADGGEPQSVQVDSHTWHRHLVGLTPGAQYEVTVISVRGFEESEPLTGFLITVPDGPTQLQALNVTDDSALLHWSPPQAPVDRYALRITAPEVPPVMASVPGGHLDFSLHNLQIRTNYTVTLRGFRGPNITSPASITFTTGLDAPHDLKAKEVTPRSALLTWTEPESPPSGYLLSYNTPGEQTKEILLPGGVTSHQLSGLFPSTLYNAWIQAIRGESLTPPVPTTFTTGGLRIPFPRDCGEEVQNGLHHSRKTTIFLNGNRERPLEVYCDMETDGGGWLVFQRRMDGHTDFWRDWAEYAHGFGNISGEFWLGNEALHSLTQAGDYSLRVDLRAGNESVFAEYDFFTVDSAAKYYRLHLEGYHGTAGDSMSYHSGSIFSTRDRDPNNLHIPCAVSYRGGWWYRNCHYVNLNGLYGSIIDHQGVSWYAWKGFEFSIPFTEMKLRPRSYNPSSQRA
ncbi:tenascin-X-like [Sarcophilus harrisii]